MITVRDLIKELGGPSKVAAICGISGSAVANWGARGDVAAEHRITIWRLAVEKSIDWTPPGAGDLVLRKREAA